MAGLCMRTFLRLMEGSAGYACSPGAEKDSGLSVSGKERGPLSRDVRMSGLLDAEAAVETG